MAEWRRSYGSAGAMARGRYRSSTRTTTRRRSRRGRGRKIIRRRFATVQPPSVIRKLPLVFYNSIDCAAGAIGTFTLTLNSGYDLAGSVSATIQNRGFDQYEALYKRYCVVGWKITIECCSTDNTNVSSLLI